MNRADYTLIGIAVIASLLILVPIISSADAQLVINATINGEPAFTNSTGTYLSSEWVPPYVAPLPQGWIPQQDTTISLTYTNGTTINQPAFTNSTGTWLISDYMQNEWSPAPYVPPTTTSTSTSTFTSSVPYTPPQPPAPTIIYDDTDEYYLYDGFIKQLAKRTTVGSNYNLVEDYITGEATWTSTIEKIQDGFTVREDGTGVPTWKNYVLDQSGNKITFNSNQIGGLVYDEPSCSYSIKENGYNGQTVIPSVSAVATGLVNGEWVNLSVNNESCVVYVTSDPDGIVITSTKINNETTFTQVLDVNVNSGIKETWKVTNDDNTQLGISQTVHTGPSIEIAGQVIDIQAVNGQSFDRQFIEANEAEILKLTDSVNYDFDEGINSLTEVNIIYDTDYKVNLDYANGLDGVPFVGYLEIDPTFTSPTTDDQIVIQTSGTGSSCDNTSINSKTSYKAIWSYLRPSGNSNANSCYLGGYQVDTSSIPDSSTITDVALTFDSDSPPGWGSTSGKECAVYDVTTDLTGTVSAAMLTDLTTGTNYIGTGDTACHSGITTYDLGTQADTDLQNNLGNDFFAMGLGWTDFTRNSNNVATGDVGDLSLSVTYTVVATVADPPTNVVATSGMPIGISWTAPTVTLVLILMVML